MQKAINVVIYAREKCLTIVDITTYLTLLRMYVSATPSDSWPVRTDANANQATIWQAAIVQWGAPSRCSSGPPHRKGLIQMRTPLHPQLAAMIAGTVLAIHPAKPATVGTRLRGGKPRTDGRGWSRVPFKIGYCQPIVV